MASTSPEGVGGNFPDNPFWDFSLATYGRPEVADACLALQDRHGIDINMLLFCCWVGASGGGVLGPAEMAAALAAAGPWQRDVVVPLRRIRSDLKGAGEAGGILKRRVAAAEIDAEHAEQLMIAATWAGRPDAARDEAQRIGDASANLGRYLEALGLAPGEPDHADLATLLDAGLEKGLYDVT